MEKTTVGGGPAGTVLALLLARQGIDVTLYQFFKVKLQLKPQ